MKFIHTADWHLGKLVQGVYMTEDQRYVLEQFVEAVKEEKPDAVIIAGDLYDRSVPPTEAVELLDDILEQIVLDLGIPVLAIAGNHDSPDRLEFATRIMEGQGLHLVGQLKAEPRPVILQDEFGEVHVHLVPYADPARVRHTFGDDAIRTHDDAMKAIIDRITERMDPFVRHVMVAHAFVTPGGVSAPNTSESERPLAVGGAEQVHAEYFAPFHYTALGHLHQAHHVGTERIRYAGSLLKYSISEEHHEKSFTIVDLDESGQVKVEKRALKARRDMRRVIGTIAEIESHEPNEDYVFVTLTDDHPVLFPMEKVRAIYPNALHVEREIKGRLVGEDGTYVNHAGRDKSTMDPAELFAAFYLEVTGQELSASRKKLFIDTWDEMLHEEGDGA